MTSYRCMKMKEFERKAYQAAIVKSTIVRFFLEETTPKLNGKSPSEKENSKKLLRSVVEQAMTDYSIDDLVPLKKLSKTEFQDHILNLVKKVRVKVEERLKVISQAEPR